MYIIGNMKPRYLISILLFAVLASAWVARMQLAGAAITAAMQRAGLNDVDLTIDQLGPDESHIARLTFSLDNADRRLQLEARDIRLSYNLRQLSAGRIDTLSIEKLMLQHKHNDMQQDPAVNADIPSADIWQPAQLVAALHQSLTRYLLFDAFSVQHLTIDDDALTDIQHRHFRLNGINDNGILSTELTLLPQSSPALPMTDQQQLISRLAEDSLHLELRFAAPDAAAAAILELHLDDTGSAAKDTVITGSYHIDPAQLQRWLYPVTDLDELADIENVDGTVSFRLLPEQQLVSVITAATRKITVGTYHAEQLAIKLKTRSATAWPPQNIQIENGSHITAGKFSHTDSSLQTSPIFFIGQLSPADSGWSYAGGFRAETLAASYPPQQLKLKQFAARISADGEKLAISGDFAPAAVPGKFGFALAHRFTTAQGQLTIRPIEPIDLNAEDHRLSQLITPWNFPIELLAGKIRLWSKTSWTADDDPRATAEIKLDDGGGTLKDTIIFSGLKFEHELALLPQLHSLRAGIVKLRHLDSGVVASNISTSLAMKTTETGTLPRLVIQDLHGEIFDGKFTSEAFVYDLNKHRSHFKIYVSDIDLAAIVATQQMEDIEVTGRLDGSIPVEINEQGLFIEHGALVNAVRNGTIRYNPAATADQLRQNPLTGIALDALKDFRYSELAADVNYTPGGMLTVNLQLKGTSPELDTERPVHLNINTEQNLIALLKSLRFAQGVSDRIDRKVRQQYEKSRTDN